MKAGQQGPQLLAPVFLNPDQVTDCACVHKGWSLLLHTGWRNTLLLPSVHLQASSVSAGVSDLRVWQTHVATNTHTLSLSFCVYAEGYVYMYTSASETESLVGMNSCRFGVYFVLVPFFFFFWGGGGGGGGRGGTKVTLVINALRVLLQQSNFLAVRLLWLLLLKCDKNKHSLHF